jgi:hypothetical protein
MKNPAQIADEFILWIGQNVDSIETPILHSGFLADSGIPKAQFHYIYNHLIADKIIETQALKIPNEATHYGIRLTFKGWEKYQNLIRKPNGKLAFMAMQFHEAKFTFTIFQKFAEKVELETGFKLRMLPEADQPMGLIDDHLRVEIKRSRFLVAEISEFNANVIWEAGYAEGFGKKVIYLCEESVFHDKERRRIFDIDHHLTIPWNEANLDIAINKLIDTIRNTFEDALGLS